MRPQTASPESEHESSRVAGIIAAGVLWLGDRGNFDRRAGDHGDRVAAGVTVMGSLHAHRLLDLVGGAACRPAA